MNKKSQKSRRHYKKESHELEFLLLKFGIQKKQVAKKAGLSMRAVFYFFSDGRKSPKISEACRQLISERAEEIKSIASEVDKDLAKITA